MTTLVLAVLGSLVGCGLWLIARGLFARRAIPLSELGRKLSGTGVSVADLSRARPNQPPGTAAIAHDLVSRYSTTNRDTLARRLRLTGRSESNYAVEKLTAAVAGFCFPLIILVVLTTTGFGPPIGWLAVGSVILGLGGFFYPDLLLAEQADARRREFRFALGAYLDFVTIMMAGGAGTQSALQAAAEAGEGWAFQELRSAIARADSTQRTVWDLFSELANDLGIDELHELAASVGLAGGQGGRIKDSLTAKADALRVTQAAELEALAESQTEKMIIPVVVMIAGLVLFIGVGAVNIVAGGATLSPADTAETRIGE